jgi:membrane protease YdiL (CAAX protease family)
MTAVSVHAPQRAPRSPSAASGRGVNEAGPRLKPSHTRGDEQDRTVVVVSERDVDTEPKPSVDVWALVSAWLSLVAARARNSCSAARTCSGLYARGLERTTAELCLACALGAGSPAMAAEPNGRGVSTSVMRASQPPTAASAACAGTPVFAWLTALYSAWVLAWLLHEALRNHTRLPLAAPAVDLAYWTIAKVLLWLTPLAWLVRRHTGVGLLAFAGLTSSRGIRLGAMLAAAWLTLQVLGAARGWFGFRLPRTPPGLPLWNAMLIAPLAEELMFRGVVQPVLRARGWSVLAALSGSALAFTLLHIPGWIFMGKLSIGACLSVLALGLGLGWVRERSSGLAACVLLHMVNNAGSSGALAFLLDLSTSYTT